MRFVKRRGDAPNGLDVNALRECLEGFPLSIAVLFGSHATDTATDLSDLDVAIQFEADVPQDRQPELLDEMVAEITRETGFEAIDLVDLSQVGPRVGYDVLSKGTLLLGDRTEAVDLESQFLQKKLDFQPVVDEWQAALAERIEEGRYGRS